MTSAEMATELVPTKGEALLSECSPASAVWRVYELPAYLFFGQQPANPDHNTTRLGVWSHKGERADLAPELLPAKDQPIS